MLRRGDRQSRRQPSAGSFLPTKRPGLALWLRSDLGIITVSGAVSQWNDQSASANNATQGTPANRPTYNSSDANYNNRPTLSFASASTQLMSLAAILPAQPFTAYVVGESTSGAQQQQFFGDSTNNVVFYWASTAWDMFAGSLITTSNSVRTKQAFGGVFNGASSALYINSSGAAAGSGNAGAMNPAGTEAIGGEAGAASNPLNGKIAEIVVYNGADTSAQVSQLFRYFASLYGGAWS